MNTSILTGPAAIAEAEAHNWAGPKVDPAKRARDLVVVANLFEAAIRGNKRAMLTMQESLASGDFTNLLGGVLERELLAQYASIAPVWPGFATRTTVRDFRSKTLSDLLGGRARLSRVEAGAPYPARSKSEATYSISVKKYGATFQLLWEAIVNDDLDALRRLPGDLAQSAIDTEDYLAASMLAISTGPDTNFFKSANGNAPAAVPLNIDNLSAALTTITSRTDTDGRPIAFPNGWALVVPPALEVTAQNVVSAFEVAQTSGSSTIKIRNWIGSRVQVVVNPWLTTIDVSNKAGATWYIVPAPGQDRPAVAMAFLRGHEVPDLRVKADTGNRVGGGAVDPLEGSFETDDIAYRVRHVAGSAQLDPKGTYASTGS